MEGAPKSLEKSGRETGTEQERTWDEGEAGVYSGYLMVARAADKTAVEAAAETRGEVLDNPSVEIASGL